MTKRDEPPTYEEAIASAPPLCPSELEALPNMGQSTEKPLPDQPGVPFGSSSAVPDPEHSPKFKVTKNGITSDDAVINSSPELLLKFFADNCDAPSMAVRIVGSHDEVRTRTVWVTDSSGKSRSRIETYTETIQDFKMEYDLTPYINGSGTIHTVPDEKGVFRSVPQLLEMYTSHKSKFKSLVLRKNPDWRLYELVVAIKSVIRSTGYPHLVRVTFPLQNHKVTVNSANSLSKFARHPATKVLFCITGLILIAWPIHRLMRKRFDKTLRADFPMMISEKQW